MYEDVATELNLEGHNFTSYAIRKKYNKLIERYKKVKDHNSKTGGFIFFLMLAHILISTDLLQKRHLWDKTICSHILS